MRENGKSVNRGSSLSLVLHQSVRLALSPRRITGGVSA